MEKAILTCALTGVLTADADAGVVATQAIVDVSYGPKGIALLKAGMKPVTIARTLRISRSLEDRALGSSEKPKR